MCPYALLCAWGDLKNLINMPPGITYHIDTHTYTHTHSQKVMLEVRRFMKFHDESNKD